ncbi:MAG TPA: hypothetical protein PK218_06940 [Flavobacterium sp.]|nr:hypothetical protein [Flavobacterium sp.]
MSKRDERQKASDVFRESNFVFSKKVGFDVAFPQIEDLTVEVEESRHGVGDWNRKSTYKKQNFPGEYINCSNSLCYNGGFSIGSILREMVRNKQTELETSKLCQGNEGSPKGRRIYRKCMNFFKIKVSIKYKVESDRNG